MIQKAEPVNDLVKLRNVSKAIVDCEHKTAPTEALGIPSIRTTDIKNGYIDLQNANKISKETYREWTKRMEPCPGDLILSREAPVGEVGIVPEGTKVCLGQRTVLIRPDCEKVVPRYLLYLLLTREMKYEMTSRAEGSIVPHLNMSDIRDLEIPALPPLDKQRQIAHILGTLDDKIELNRQMNETLEAMARAIFKSWFVDFDPARAKMEGRQPAGMDAETAALFPSTFQDSPLGKIPEEWEVARFADLADVILGGDWGKETESDNYLHPTLCIRGADISSLQTGGLGDMPIRYLKTSSLAKRQLRSGDLVIEISGGSPTQSTGRAMLINKELLDRLNFPLVYSNFCRLIRLKPEDMSNFVYLWFRRLYSNDEFFQYENGTTGIKNLAFMVFAQENNILVPPMPIVNAFNRKIEPLFTMLQLNGEQSRTLSQIRDTLLPKLLSGKIRVDDVDKGLEVKDGGTS